MNEYENIISFTGRGFSSTLEASVICEAIEKSTLLEESKKTALLAFAKELGKQGALIVIDFIEKIKESFPDDTGLMDTVREIIKSLSD